MDDLERYGKNIAEATTRYTQILEDIRGGHYTDLALDRRIHDLDQAQAIISFYHRLYVEEQERRESST